MDAKQILMFNHWLEQNYPVLYRRLTDTDSLHDAYLTLTRLSSLTAEEYLSFLERAYNLHRRRYAQYIFRFIVPDPRFWLYQDEEGEDGYAFANLGELEQQKQQQEKQNHMKAINFMNWLRRHSTEAEFIIFRMFYHEAMELPDIARITGKTKPQILSLMNEKREQYIAAQQRKPVKSAAPAKSAATPVESAANLGCSKPKSNATAPAICFRISTQGHYQIIPTRKYIEYMHLCEGDMLLFAKEKSQFSIKSQLSILRVPRQAEKECVEISKADDTLTTCRLRRGTRPYNLQAQCRKVVADVLSEVGATTSVTLRVLPTADKEQWLIDLNNPIKIN